MTTNIVSYNESIIPHTLVCITKPSTAIPVGWTGVEFDYTTLFASCSGSGIGTNIADYYYTDFQDGCTQSIPPSPINVLNASSVQSFLDTTVIPAVNACNGTSFVSGDIIYTVNGTTIVVWYNPSYNPTFNNFVFGDIAGGGCEKQSPSIPTSIIPSSGSTNISAQLVKYRLHNGVIIDKFYTIEPNPVEILVDLNTMSITPGACKIVLSNYPITNIINSNSTFSTTIDYYSLSYSVIGSNGSLTTPHNGITRILFDGESGEFKGDDQKTLDNILTFTTGASTSIIINAIVKL